MYIVEPDFKEGGITQNRIKYYSLISKRRLLLESMLRSPTLSPIHLDIRHICTALCSGSWLLITDTVVCHHAGSYIRGAHGRLSIILAIAVCTKHINLW